GAMPRRIAARTHGRWSNAATHRGTDRRGWSNAATDRGMDTREVEQCRDGSRHGHTTLHHGVGAWFSATEEAVATGEAPATTARSTSSCCRSSKRVEHAVQLLDVRKMHLDDQAVL